MKRSSFFLILVGTACVALGAVLPTQAQDQKKPSLLRFEPVSSAVLVPKDSPLIETMGRFPSAKKQEDGSWIVGGHSWRAKVPGGWLVSNERGSMVFVPDANHAWDGGSLR